LLIRFNVGGFVAILVAKPEAGAKMKCDKCGKRPERYYPARQSDAPGFARNF